MTYNPASDVSAIQMFAIQIPTVFLNDVTALFTQNYIFGLHFEAILRPTYFQRSKISLKMSMHFDI